MLPDPRIASAAMTFDALARRCGLAPEGFTERLIWHKQEAGRNHVVVEYRRGQVRLVLKQGFGKDTTGFRPGIEMQMRAALALKASPTAHAPEVLALDEDTGAALMQAVEGETLDELLAEGADPLPLIRQAGLWLAAFHRALGIEKRFFQPRFMLNHLATHHERIAEKPALVAEPELYLACSAQLSDLALPYHGQPTVSAVRHGDYNLRNLIIGPDGATAIDFKPAQTALVGFDIVRILLDHATLYGDPQNASRAGLVDPAVLGAFFAGYDLVNAQDPSVRFLTWVQFLTDWRAIPADPERQSLRQMQRLARITAMARRAFAVRS